MLATFFFFIVLFFAGFNWTANQSCFSPLPVFFHFTTKGGAVPSCSPKETYLLQIRGPEMEQNKQECEQLLCV